MGFVTPTIFALSSLNIQPHHGWFKIAFVTFVRKFVLNRSVYCYTKTLFGRHKTTYKFVIVHYPFAFCYLTLFSLSSLSIQPPHEWFKEAFVTFVRKLVYTVLHRSAHRFTKTLFGTTQNDIRICNYTLPICILLSNPLFSLLLKYSITP